LKLKSKENFGSITDFTKAIEIDPKNGNAYLNRGLIRIDMKNKVDGCSDLQMALYLGIKDAKKVIDQYCK